MATAKIIPFIAPEPPPPVEPQCSFCLRLKSAVPTLIVGEVACICGDCLAHATQRISETEETS